MQNIGEKIGAVLVGAVLIGWVVWDMASCIYVNPCPVLAEDIDRATDRGDWAKAEDALVEYIDAGCDD